MIDSEESLDDNKRKGPFAVAIQGNEQSYHAVAANRAFGHLDLGRAHFSVFPDVVEASRTYEVGLGIMAIHTFAGTVHEAAREIVGVSSSGLPTIVGRVDLPVELALIGSRPQSFSDLQRTGVSCLAQRAAFSQCRAFLDEHLPLISVEQRDESTEAISEVLDRDELGIVAIGPTVAAQQLGGAIIGPPQINPTDSVTSFYVLQRDPREHHIFQDPSHTEVRAVMSVDYPHGVDGLENCLAVANQVGVEVARFIPYDLDDSEPRRQGGLIELVCGMYSTEAYRFCEGIYDIDRPGIDPYDVGPYTPDKLGEYHWLPDKAERLVI